MKIRNGFVSNSSSSSFVMYGAKIKLSASKAEKLYDIINDTDLSNYSDEEGDCSYVYLGESLLDLDEGGISKIELKNINQAEVKERVLKFVEPLKIKVPDSAFAIYGGTSYN